MSVEWASGPPISFQTELMGGPFDGSLLTMSTARWSCLPPDYWDVPIPAGPPFLIANTTNFAVPTFQRARYRRGEAMRDRDHVWPYDFVGVF